MAIRIENLRYSYDESSREILKGVNLNIKRGKFTGILGPNGCGKSTLLKNITGFLQRKEGSISFGEIEDREITRKEMAKKVALVPQKSSLSSPITVEDFVMMGRIPHLKSSWDGFGKEDRERVACKLRDLKLEKFKNRVAMTLSGGEFQRVLLARALSQEPEILLLDEPTSALDLNHAVELLSQVRSIVLNEGITGVAVLHDLNLAGMFCHELVIIGEGKVLYKGTPKEVLTEEILLEVYNLKAKVFIDENGIPVIVPKI